MPKAILFIFVFTFVQMLFIALKLSLMVQWSWWIVFSPWIALCVGSVVFSLWLIEKTREEPQNAQLDFFDLLDERS